MAPEAPEAPPLAPPPVDPAAERSDGTGVSEPTERFVGYTLWLGHCEAGNPPSATGKIRA